MADRRLAAKYFDNSKTLIATRNMTVEGHEVHAGKPLPGDLSKGLRMRLWVTRRVVYEADYRPTPTAEPESEVRVTEAGGGWYQVEAPWLAEPEKVQGKDKAEARAAELREAGDPKGVHVEGGDGGWFEVRADWLADPAKIQGREAADEHAAQLRAEGPPEGWNAGDEPLTAEAIEAAKAGAAGDANATETPDHAALVELAEEGSNGWYVISAPWMADGLKIRGKDKAEAELARIREEGPPEGWTANPQE